MHCLISCYSADTLSFNRYQNLYWQGKTGICCFLFVAGVSGLSVCNNSGAAAFGCDAQSAESQILAGLGKWWHIDLQWAWQGTDLWVTLERSKLQTLTHNLCVFLTASWVTRCHVTVIIQALSSGKVALLDFVGILFGICKVFLPPSSWNSLLEHLLSNL